jgi:hypothetical protein
MIDKTSDPSTFIELLKRINAQLNAMGEMIRFERKFRHTGPNVVGTPAASPIQTMQHVMLFSDKSITIQQTPV